MFNYILHFTDKIIARGMASRGGRNFQGRLCVFHKGGSSKRLGRFVDIYRRVNQMGLLYKILKDLNRTAFIGLIVYENGLISYIVLSYKTFVSDNIYSGVSFLKDLGYSSSNTLENLPLLSVLNNIELYPFCGSKIARAAGTRALLTRKINGMAFFKIIFWLANKR